MKAVDDFQLIFSTGETFPINGIVIYYPKEGLFEFNFKLDLKYRVDFEKNISEFFKIDGGMINFKIKETTYDILGLQYRAYGYYL